MSTTPSPARCSHTLFTDLQTAVELEWATLPPYLYARWSLVDPTSHEALTIQRVISEEMLHLGMACNILNAIGGDPAFGPAQTPAYPGALPGHAAQGNFQVSLGPWSAATLDTFVRIEAPDPQAGGTAAANAIYSACAGGWTSIGEFYSEIERHLRALDPSAFHNRRQLVMARPHGGGVLYAMSDPSAEERKRLSLAAAEEIIVQGEGASASHHGVKQTERSHYQRFIELREAFDRSPPQIHPVVANPTAHLDRYSDKQRQLDTAFCSAYSDLIDALQRTFRSERPDIYSAAGPAMLRMTEWAKRLRESGPLASAGTKPTGPELPGPTFRYVPSTDRLN